jgi:hypothetical protein
MLSIVVLKFTRIATSAQVMTSVVVKANDLCQEFVCSTLESGLTHIWSGSFPLLPNNCYVIGLLSLEYIFIITDLVIVIVVVVVLVGKYENRTILETIFLTLFFPGNLFSLSLLLFNLAAFPNFPFCRFEKLLLFGTLIFRESCERPTPAPNEKAQRLVNFSLFLFAILLFILRIPVHCVLGALNGAENMEMLSTLV